MLLVLPVCICKPVHAVGYKELRTHSAFSVQSMSLTVHSPSYRKRKRCETPHPFMALKRDPLHDSRHRPNASNIALFALKAAGSDDWLKRNIHHDTTAGDLLRNKTEAHTALLPTNRRRWTDIVLMMGERRRPWANIKTTYISVRVNMTSQRRRHRASIKSTVVSVTSLNNLA